MEKKEELRDCISQYMFGMIREILKCGNDGLENLYRKREDLYKSIQNKIADPMRYDSFAEYIKAVNKRIEKKTVFCFTEGIKGTESAFLLLEYENKVRTKKAEETEKLHLSRSKINWEEYIEFDRLNKEYEDKLSISAYKNCDKIIKILSTLYK